jgi:thiol-disulfide isomerase/thioredoxin
MMKYCILAISMVLLTLSDKAFSQVPLQTAVDFSVKDVKSESHHLFSYLDNNKIVVLDFFTTNCGPCQTYATEVSQAYEYFGCNDGNVVFMGINWGSNNQAVTTFDSLWDARYPSVSGLQGGGNGVVEDYEVLSYPTVIVITPDHNIAVNYIWPPLFDSIVQEVSLLGGIPANCTVNTLDSDVNQSNIRVTDYGEISVSSTKSRSTSNIISIYSLQGNLLWQETLPDVSGCIIKPSLKKGLYIARLISDGKVEAVSKVLIK